MTAATTPTLRNRLAEYARDPFALICLICFALLVSAALLADLLAPTNPFDLAQVELFDSRLPPGSVSDFSGRTYLLGTDTQGRDVLSILLYGTRISLFVAVVSAVGACVLGVSVGILAAYFGGVIDSALMRLTELFLSFPSILIAMLLLALFGRGIDNTILAIILAQWVNYARITRAVASVEMTREYVSAVRLLRFSNARILVHHVLPNCVPAISVAFTVQLGYVIALEAALSYLGLGMPVSQPSLGSLVAAGQTSLLSGAYWISLFPGITLLALTFTANVVGDRLRLLYNPQLRSGDVAG